MQEECLLICLLLLVLYMIYINSSYEEYMTGPLIFYEEGYGESGSYYDNINIEPVYRTIRQPTIYS